MSHSNRHFNPFYGMLVVVGAAFCITAFAYGILMVRAIHGVDPSTMSPIGLWLHNVLDRQGAALLTIELTALAVCTVGAMTTDRFWIRRDTNR